MIELYVQKGDNDVNINIFDSTSTGNLTTVNEQLKLKLQVIAMMNDGSGHCPGIGTKFAVTAKTVMVHRKYTCKNSSGTLTQVKIT
ncbi:MAG: hypothetical protein CM15mL6_200 [uncultured marine virus]|nr:MAG: hypothetical protein CM15mL6_200 [uncultured marine virus]